MDSLRVLGSEMFEVVGNVSEMRREMLKRRLLEMVVNRGIGVGMRVDSDSWLLGMLMELVL